MIEFWNKINEKECYIYINELRKISYVPFIGSGMSKGFGYPIWSDFLRNLLDKYYTDAEEEKKIGNDMLMQGKYLDLADYIDKKMNGCVAESVRYTFHPEKMKNVNEKENYLLLLRESAVNTIITTNFDEVIENYLEISGKDICIASTLNTTIDLMDNIRNRDRTKKILIKLHGTWDQHASIILGKEKFESAYCQQNNILTNVVDYIWKNTVLLF